jgi:hypothetical protein
VHLSSIQWWTDCLFLGLAIALPKRQWISIHKHDNRTRLIDLRFAVQLMQKFRVHQALAVEHFPCTITGAGQTFSYCNPEYNSWPFEGNFLQFFDPNPAKDCNLGACPNTGYLSPSLQTNKVIAVLASVKLLLMAMLHTTIVGLTTTMLLQVVFAGQRMVMLQIMEMSSSAQLIHSLVTHELVLCK